MLAHRLTDDREAKYRIRPVLLETFVDPARFSGTCYKAANWRYVGQTKGPGKLCPAGKQDVKIKDIWPYHVSRRCRQWLSD